MYQKNETAIGAYATEQRVFETRGEWVEPPLADDGSQPAREYVEHREELLCPNSGFAAYDKSGTAWPVSANEAITINQRRVK
jgi:hypothetical protein